MFLRKILASFYTGPMVIAPWSLQIWAFLGSQLVATLGGVTAIGGVLGEYLGVWLLGTPGSDGKSTGENVENHSPMFEPLKELKELLNDLEKHHFKV